MERLWHRSRRKHLYFVFFSLVYLIAMLGFGLVVSTYAETQQKAHSLTFFFVLIFNLMRGLYTSSIAGRTKVIAWFIPIKYFIEVVRMVMLKGSSLYDSSTHPGIVLQMGLV